MTGLSLYPLETSLSALLGYPKINLKIDEKTGSRIYLDIHHSKVFSSVQASQILLTKEGRIKHSSSNPSSSGLSFSLEIIEKSFELRSRSFSLVINPALGRPQSLVITRISRIKLTPPSSINQYPGPRL